MNAPLKILHLEDCPEDAELARSLLRSEGIDNEITVVRGRAEFIAAFEEKQFDLIIADYQLPSFDGMSALKIACKKTPGTPFIFLSGVIGEDAAIDSLLNGATDYVLKQKMTRFIPAVKRAISESEGQKRRMQADRLVEEARAYASNIVETVREPLLVIDKSLRVKTANSAFYKTFRVDKEGTENKFIYDVGNGEWNYPALRPLLEEILVKNTFLHDFEIKRDFPGIGEKTMILNANRIVGKEDLSPMILLAFEDVTERKKAEDAVRKAVEVKSEFTAMVSHELRTPLTVIKEGVDIVLDGTDGPLNDEQKKHLQLAIRNVDRMARLINNVLSYQKLESGKVEFMMRSHDINELVRDVVDGFMPVFRRKGLELKSDLAGGLPFVWCDRDRLTEVITNLLNNALKFTEHGCVRVKTYLDERWVHVSVQDQGIGIREEDCPRLFQSFSQIGDETNHKLGGTGLGLAISKRIMDRHRGRIQVQSVYRQGATFSFSLPIQSASAVEMNKKILVADDEADIIDLISSRLSKAGYEVIAANDGEEALDLLTHVQPRLILLDYKMPFLNGHEVCKRIKTDDRWKAIPVIFLTASPQAATPELMRSIGADDYLIKPFEAPELFEKIYRFLK